MGSLENTLSLARAASDALQKVYAPSDVRLEMDTVVHPKYQALSNHGPSDQWWDHISKLFQDCTSQAPPDCVSIADYAQWAEHLNRFWCTALSCREMFMQWTGSDPSRNITNISPPDGFSVRAVTKAEANNIIGVIERIGNETITELQKKGIDCFPPFSRKQYEGYFIRHLYPQTRLIFPKSDPASPCGYYNWIKRAQVPSLFTPAQTIGKEILRIRTLWPAEIAPDRVAFRPVSSHNLTAGEGAMRIMFDLMQVSIDTKLPVVVPPSRKQS